MTDILLQYAMPITKTIPLAPANTQYIREILVIAKPSAEATPNQITRVTSEADIAAITDAQGVKELFSGGKTYFYIAAQNAIDLTAIENVNDYEFFTVLIDPAFTKEEVNAAKYGDFKGVIGYATTEEEYAKSFGSILNQSAFIQSASNSGENMYNAFGRLLSGTSWKSQQFALMPYDDQITDIGLADAYFLERINFVLTSKQYGVRLALFVAGGNGDARAIVAPYIYEELQVTLQGRTVTYLNLNQPDYTPTQAKLLQNYLQATIDDYIERGVITDGFINVTADGQKFMFNGNAQVPEPSAVWRVPTNFIEGGE